jgi:hypothetical protein
MTTIRMIYRYEDGGWTSESPDLAALGEGVWFSGGETFAEARALAEEGVPWSYQRDDLVLEHFVPETALAQLLAERAGAVA